MRLKIGAVEWSDFILLFVKVFKCADLPSWSILLFEFYSDKMTAAHIDTNGWAFNVSLAQYRCPTRWTELHGISVGASECKLGVESI